MPIILALIALLPLGQDPKSFHIEVIDQLDDTPISLAEPLGLVQLEDALFVLDTNFRIWSVDGNALQAHLLGTHPVVAFRALFAREDKLLLLDQNGFRSTYFNQQGLAKGSVTTRIESFYEDQHNRISLHTPTETASSPITIHWKRRDRAVTYPFSDKPGRNATVVAATAMELLLTSNDKGEISYAVLNLKDGGLHCQGSLVLPTEYNQSIDRPLGVTAHPIYGFTLTQHAGGEDFYVHQLAPASTQWSSKHLTLAPNEKLLFCHRLGENTWLAHTGKHLQRFRLVPSS